MTFPGLHILGERINPGFTSTKRLFDEEDMAGIQALAKKQADAGAEYLNINVGDRARTDPQFMVEVVKAVQAVVPTPLSFDFPNVEVQEYCLKAYSLEKAQGQLPIVNSISELRWDMLDLYKIAPFKMLLMASEREEGGEQVANKNADEVHQTARRMVQRVTSSAYGISNDDCFIDVSIGPVGADTEGLTKMALDGIKAIGSDTDLAGVHMSVGLSNASIMLPKEALDGGLLKIRIENAFLTLAVPAGMDFVLGTPWRHYQPLPADDIVMEGFVEAIEAGGFEQVMRIQEIYMDPDED